MNEKIKIAKEALKTLYSDEGDERCGFILVEGDMVVECKNVSKKPSEGFVIDPVDVKNFIYLSWATWHTHPNWPGNLSTEDYRNFKDWPDVIHFVIGKNETRAFQWNAQKEAVVEL